MTRTKLISLIILSACGTQARTVTDSSMDTFVPPENTLEVCMDGVDNDGDGATDCNDRDCWNVQLTGADLCGPLIGNIQRGRYQVGDKVNIEGPRSNGFRVHAIGPSGQLYAHDTEYPNGPYNGILINHIDRAAFFTDSKNNPMTFNQIRLNDIFPYVGNLTITQGPFGTFELDATGADLQDWSNQSNDPNAPLAPIDPFLGELQGLTDTDDRLDSVLITLPNLTVLGMDNHNQFKVKDQNGVIAYIGNYTLDNNLLPFSTTCIKSTTGMPWFIPMDTGTNPGQVYSFRTRSLQDFVACN